MFDGHPPPPSTPFFSESLASKSVSSGQDSSEQSSSEPSALTISHLPSSSIAELVRIERESKPSPWNYGHFFGEFSNKFSKVLGVHCGQQLVGFLIIHVIVDEVHIVNFAITPKYRCQGIGRHFLTEVLKELYWRGAAWAYLEVRVSNEIAISLYGSLGFSRVGLRKNYYSDNSEDAAVFSLELSRFIAPYGEQRAAIVNE